MELYAPEIQRWCMDRSHRAIGRTSDDLRAGNAVDAVAMRHPHRLLGGEIGKQRTGGVADDVGAAKFAMIRFQHLASVVVRGDLHAVADAQYGHTELKDRGVDLRRTGDVHRGWPARQDDAGGALHRGGGGMERVDLAEDLGLADAACDQLGHLRPEIKNDDLLVGHVLIPAGNSGLLW